MRRGRRYLPIDTPVNPPVRTSLAGSESMWFEPDSIAAGHALATAPDPAPGSAPRPNQGGPRTNPPFSKRLKKGHAYSRTTWRPALGLPSAEFPRVERGGACPSSQAGVPASSLHRTPVAGRRSFFGTRAPAPAHAGDCRRLVPAPTPRHNARREGTCDETHPDTPAGDARTRAGGGRRPAAVARIAGVRRRRPRRRRRRAGRGRVRRPDPPGRMAHRVPAHIRRRAGAVRRAGADVDAGGVPRDPELGPADRGREGAARGAAARTAEQALGMLRSDGVTHAREAWLRSTPSIFAMIFLIAPLALCATSPKPRQVLPGDLPLA